MITKTEAVITRTGRAILSVLHQNADGTPQRFRVSGRCKTWKTRPNEFRLPVKRGLYQHGYITHENAQDFVWEYASPLENFYLVLDGNKLATGKTSPCPLFTRELKEACLWEDDTLLDNPRFYLHQYVHDLKARAAFVKAKDWIK